MDIDVVVLWVDGNDPEWKKQKDKYQNNKVDDSNDIDRFRDWGLIKYWFRGIEKFMPWVRTIHFVTCGHVPDFLNLENKRLNFVKHEDILPKECLPTFNSQAIEMNIHRIPGLAEHFIYFNDDMFVLRNLKEETFFKNGKPCGYVTECALPILSLRKFEYASFNDVGIINLNFDKKIQLRKYKKNFINKAYSRKHNIRSIFAQYLYPNYYIGFSHQHAPNSYLKSSFEEVWNAAPERLENTTKNRFRNEQDVNQWLVLWWQAVSGNFEPYPVDNLMLPVYKSSLDTICHAITNQEHDFYTLNDRSDVGDFEGYKKALADAFERILPNKSSFER